MLALFSLFNTNKQKNPNLQNPSNPNVEIEVQPFTLCLSSTSSCKARDFTQTMQLHQNFATLSQNPNKTT